MVMAFDNISIDNAWIYNLQAYKRNERKNRLITIDNYMTENALFVK